jgi:hypothetical protein
MPDVICAAFPASRLAQLLESLSTSRAAEAL